MDEFEKLDAEIRKRHMARKIVKRLIEKPEIIDRLIDALESKNIVDWDGNPVDDDGTNAVQV